MNAKGYFDYAAATPIDPLVKEAMDTYEAANFANPSSMHSPGRQAKKTLEAARATISQVLGAKPAEIVFTSGSTEAAQIAVGGVLGRFLGAEAAVAEIEHKAVLGAIASSAQKPPRIIPCSFSGITSPEAARDAISDNTVLVCVQYANNEIGTLQPIIKIAAEIKRLRAERLSRGIDLPLYFYCDAAQAGLLSLQVSRLGVDLLSMGSSKIYGPAGTGFLYIRTGTQLKPLHRGGGQEGGLRSGTENVAGAVGISRALSLIQATRTEESQRLTQMRQRLLQIITNKIEDVTLHGTLDHRLPHNLHLSFKGCRGETLAAHLDAVGFAVATGSACMASNDSPSHVLTAIGCTEAVAESSIRVSWGRFTQEDDLAAFAEALIKAVAAIRQFAK